MIRVDGEGFWSEAIVHAYFAELRKAVQERRLAHRKIRILVDICSAPAQSANIVDQILAGLNEMLAPDDKLTVIVKAVILKRQSERLGTQVGTHRVFISVGRRSLAERLTPAIQGFGERKCVPSSEAEKGCQFAREAREKQHDRPPHAAAKRISKSA